MDWGQRESGFENIAQRENDYKAGRWSFSRSKEKRNTSIISLVTFK